MLARPAPSPALTPIGGRVTCRFLHLWDESAGLAGERIALLKMVSRTVQNFSRPQDLRLEAAGSEGDEGERRKRACLGRSRTKSQQNPAGARDEKSCL